MNFKVFVYLPLAILIYNTSHAQTDLKTSSYVSRTFDEANKFCNGQGKRLPSAREAAAFEEKNGAAGIMEVKDMAYLFRTSSSEMINQKTVKLITRRPFMELVESEYHLIETLSSEGKIDRFYFSESGYKNPILASSWIWTSSPLAVTKNLNYVFSADYGTFYLVKIKSDGEEHPLAMNTICVD